MILKLPYRPFKNMPYMTERDIDIMLRIGSLEDLCDRLGIEFWQIKDYMTKNNDDFYHLLLYHGYLTSCQKRYEKPKFTEANAVIWYQYMNISEKKKFISEISLLFGKMVKTYKSDKKKVTTR